MSSSRDTALAHLKGKTLAWIGAGDISKKFIFETAKKHGVRSIVVDSNDAPWLTETGLVDEIIKVPFLDDHVDAMESLEELRKRNIDGCLTFWEPEVYDTARLCEALQLPGASAESVDKARFKLRTRDCMRADGLPSPASLLVTDEESLERAMQEIPGFPCIFKPAAGYNSFSTYRVDNADQARQAMAEVIELSKDETRFDALMFRKHGIRMLLETFLDGIHIDVDVVMDNGRVAFYCVSMEVPHYADPTFKPMFVTPADIDPNKETACIDLAIKACECLGLTHGVFNVECKYTETNPSPMVLEINARMGGTFLAHTIKAAYEVDLPEQIMLLACGIPSPLSCTEDERQRCYKPWPLIQYACGIDVYGVQKSPDALSRLADERSDVVLTLNMLAEKTRNVTCADLAGVKTHNGWAIAVCPPSGSMQEAIAAACEAEKHCIQPKPVDLATGKTDPRKLFGRTLEDSLHSRSVALFQEIARLRTEGANRSRQLELVMDFIRREDAMWRKHLQDAGDQIVWARHTGPDVEFPSDCRWYNVEEPLRMDSHLRGKIVLADFWTYCCVNCLHIIPQMEQLEAKYPPSSGVAWVGVHAGKFSAERDPANLLAAVLRHNVGHAVVSDPEMVLMEKLSVKLYPTFIIFGPFGNRICHYTDDDVQKGMTDLFMEGATKFYGPDKLNKQPLPIRLERDKQPLSASGLSFPGGVLADTASGRLYVSDSQHHRVVVLDLSGSFVEQYGCGTRGLKNGDASIAEFNFPNGLALHNRVLYVADTDNHCVRAVDLSSPKRSVTTILGTGERLEDPRLDRRSLNVKGKGNQQKTSSPWALAVDPATNALYVAVAGIHQLWRVDLRSGDVELFSGTGREENKNGSDLLQCGWGQPSGLSLLRNAKDAILYVADCETSSCRQVDLVERCASSVAGGDPENSTNLWSFGDAEGKGSLARFQHPMDVCWIPSRNAICVADSYNHRLKLVYPEDGFKVVNWVGSGDSGLKDGANMEAHFYEPTSMSLSHDSSLLYVADTNNHCIRVVDVTSGVVSTLQVRQLPTLQALPGEIVTSSAAPAGTGKHAPSRRGNTVSINSFVGAGQGEGKLHIKLHLPQDFHFTLGASSKYRILPTQDKQEGVEVFVSSNKGDLAGCNGDINIPFTYSMREGTCAKITVAVNANFCHDTSGMCALANVVFELHMVSRSADGEDEVLLEYAFPDPSWRPLFHPVGYRQLGM